MRGGEVIFNIKGGRRGGTDVDSPPKGVGGTDVDPRP